MKRFLPDSLAAWVIVVLVTGLAVSQVATLAIDAGSRARTVTVLAHFRLAERMADLVRLAAATPAPARETLLASVRSGTLRATWSPRADPLGTETDAEPASLFAQVMRAALWDVPWRTLRASFAPAPALPVDGRPGHRPSDVTTGIGRRLDSILAQHSRVPVLHVALQLDDTSWLNFEAPFVEDPPLLSPAFFGLAAIAALAVMAATFWAIRRLTDPLLTLARAAERLGGDVNAPPLEERGAREVRQAAHAFNVMQARLRRYVQDRVQMTAAISHDLRTPITRLRLRAEFIDDDELRGKLLADLDHMETLIDATLAFAREESSNEAPTDVDLPSLVEDVCDGLPGVEFVGTGSDPRRLSLRCRPAALRRCLGNLVDNAVKYGGGARVHVERSAGVVHVTVDDDGPGIPSPQLEDVFEPYVRLEASRNEETGGVGLGLSIARTVARAHGGEVRLANRPGRGLRATLELPC